MEKRLFDSCPRPVATVSTTAIVMLRRQRGDRLKRSRFACSRCNHTHIRSTPVSFDYVSFRTTRSVCVDTPLDLRGVVCSCKIVVQARVVTDTRCVVELPNISRTRQKGPPFFCFSFSFSFLFLSSSFQFFFFVSLVPGFVYATSVPRRRRAPFCRVYE